MTSLFQQAEVPTTVDAAPVLLLGRVILPQVNLLPPEIEQRRRLRQVQTGLGAAVVATMGVVALLYVAAAASVSGAQDDLDAASTRHAGLLVEATQYDRVTDVRTRAQAAESMLTEAMGQEVRWSRVLADLSLTVPDNVWLTNVALSQSSTAAGPVATVAGTSPSVTGPAPAGGPIGTVTFTGVGFSHDDVAVWLESLTGQSRYADPTFSSSAESLKGSRKVVTFTSTASLTPAALSGRYTTPAGG